MRCPHCKKEIKPKQKSNTAKKEWSIDDHEFTLALNITALIIKNHPTFEKKLSTSHYRKKAAQAVAECIKEGFLFQDVWEICQWVCRHEFWKNQFQSTMKLTRKDNGNTGLSLKWIQRFENEMKKDGRRSIESISDSFEFTKEKKPSEY